MERALAAALLAACVAGCGQTGGAGGSETTAKALPVAAAGPPAYAPLYPGAVIDSPAAVGGPAFIGAVSFHTADDPAAVIAFYRRTAKALGFSATFFGQSGDDQLFSAGKPGADQGLQVIATPADKGASVQLVWTGPRRGATG